MVKLPEGSIILLRRPRKGPVATFEANIAQMATTHGLRVEWWEPDEGGREVVFNRDFEMVTSADYVIAYFNQEQPMEGGTAHVVDAAMMRGIKVTAYTMDKRGLVEFLGEFDGEE